MPASNRRLEGETDEIYHIWGDFAREGRGNGAAFTSNRRLEKWKKQIQPTLYCKFAALVLR